MAHPHVLTVLQPTSFKIAFALQKLRSRRSNTWSHLASMILSVHYQPQLARTWYSASTSLLMIPALTAFTIFLRSTTMLLPATVRRWYQALEQILATYQHGNASYLQPQHARQAPPGI